ncbi:MAG: arsenate reductase, partial [candidate division Zixibacteria bacterium]|nr:arsenate reductase [candidate division Zixibacteria bacterium]NIU14965.1 arsenate reductase [candidate division Zixibacteria bacterium]NIV06984.1 arsenate reductase [candidate division Zixibacteria bacterium]NIW43020.1 arsenate reductase [candidate division Zixibacteria bacterium]NIX57123.1 arsenate reductase [candidate division Zixibacteria bacterium]
GVDITGQSSKEIDLGLLHKMDLVITVCDNAAEACPFTPPSVKRIHLPIKDPVGAIGTEDEIMNEFRRARDEIRQAMEKVLQDYL